MVNTFVVADDPKETAKLLDYRRLGKQRVECKQIILTLETLYDNASIDKEGKIGCTAGNQSRSWANHPAVHMWIGYITGLKYYHNCMIDEWVTRGYKNTMSKYEIPEVKVLSDILPWWCFNKQVQLSHKCSLLRKDAAYYAKIFVLNEEEKAFLDLGYIWPSRLSKETIKVMQKGTVVKEAHDAIGGGSPAQYRYSKEEVGKWLSNKEVNPKTGRKITSTGAVYRDYAKAAKFYGL